MPSEPGQPVRLSCFAYGPRGIDAALRNQGFDAGRFDGDGCHVVFPLSELERVVEQPLLRHLAMSARRHWR